MHSFTFLNTSRQTLDLQKKLFNKTIKTLFVIMFFLCTLITLNCFICKNNTNNNKSLQNFAFFSHFFKENSQKNDFFYNSKFSPQSATLNNLRHFPYQINHNFSTNKNENNQKDKHFYDFKLSSQSATLNNLRHSPYQFVDYATNKNENGQNIFFYNDPCSPLHTTLNNLSHAKLQFANYDTTNNKSKKSQEETKSTQLLKFDLFIFIFLCSLPVIVVILLLLTPKISQELIAKNFSSNKSQNKQNLCFDKKRTRTFKHDNFDDENL